MVVSLLRASVTIESKRHEKQFANDAVGHRHLLRWVHALAKDALCHFCLESTGPYSQSVALFLVEKEQKVSVINPARIRFFGLSLAWRRIRATRPIKPTHV